MKIKMTLFIFAERCDGPFYMGWWLYADEVIDGAVQNGGSRLWLREPWMLLRVLEMVGSLTQEEFPDVKERNNSDFALAFARHFRSGVMLELSGIDLRCWDITTARPAPQEYQHWAASGDPITRDPNIAVGTRP